MGPRNTNPISEGYQALNSQEHSQKCRGNGEAQGGVPVGPGERKGVDIAESNQPDSAQDRGTGLAFCRPNQPIKITQAEGERTGNGQNISLDYVPERDYPL